MSDHGKLDTRARSRLRHAAELLAADSSLRDNLSDAQAKQLLDWGLAHAEEAANRTSLLGDEIALPVVEDVVAKVRRSMRLVARIMGLMQDHESTTGGDTDLDAPLISLLKNASLLTGKSPTPSHLAHAERAARRQEPLDGETTFRLLMALIHLDAARLSDENA